MAKRVYLVTKRKYDDYQRQLAWFSRHTKDLYYSVFMLAGGSHYSYHKDGKIWRSPPNFIKGNRKFIYNPANKTTCVYDLITDPEEQNRIELPEQESKRISDEIVTWRINTIFRIDQQRSGKRVLFDQWACRWTDRVSSTKRIKN